MLIYVSNINKRRFEYNAQTTLHTIDEMHKEKYPSIYNTKDETK